jgi:hypothetical protein
MEFCASIQLTSLAMMLTNYYAKSRSSPQKVAAALTAVGLASTTGAFLAKTGGTALASTCDWRTVARVGSLIALFGSWVASKAPIQPFQQEDLAKKQKAASAKPIGSWLKSTCLDVGFVSCERPVASVLCVSRRQRR